jgi:hypothetical protein
VHHSKIRVYQGSVVWSKKHYMVQVGLVCSVQFQSLTRDDKRKILDHILGAASKDHLAMIGCYCIYTLLLICRAILLFILS